MRTVTVNTSNNVSIDYELATVQQRIMAFVVDAVILIVWSIIVQVMSKGFASYKAAVLQSLLMLPAMTYSLWCEAFLGGQTIGKRTSGLKVVRLDGRPASFNECFQRWVFRLLDIYITLGSMAVLFISSGIRAQRMGDILAQTVVINLNPRHSLQIGDLLTMDERKEGENRLAGVLRYNDDDMLTVKLALDRYKKFRNDAHQKIIIKLTDKISAQMGIERSKIKDEHGFLKKVLQDYIVLTRS